MDVSLVYFLFFINLGCVYCGLLKPLWQETMLIILFLAKPADKTRQMKYKKTQEHICSAPRLCVCVCF